MKALGHERRREGWIVGDSKGNDAASYALASGDPDAGNRWNAVRASAEWLRILTYDIRLRVSGRAQWSSQALVAGEQFALGGAAKPWGSSFGLWPRSPWIERDGVRGLAERAATGYRGAQASIELWSRRLWGQDLRFAAFIDAGTVRAKAPSLPHSDNASSAGVLAHWQWRGQLAFALSAAQLLDGGRSTADHSKRIDLTLVARY